MDLVAAVDVVLRDFKDTDNQLQFSMFILTNSEAIVPVKVVLKATEVQVVHNNYSTPKHLTMITEALFTSDMFIGFTRSLC